VGKRGTASRSKKAKEPIKICVSVARAQKNEKSREITKTA